MIYTKLQIESLLYDAIRSMLYLVVTLGGNGFSQKDSGNTPPGVSDPLDGRRISHLASSAVAGSSSLTALSLSYARSHN